MPTVININQAPKGWTNNPNYVYIGRPRVIEGKAFSGEWGNPHPVNYPCTVCSAEQGTTVIHTRGTSIPFFERDIRFRLTDEPELEQKIRDLNGKTLVCFCKPNPCHGDILAKICVELNREDRP